MNDIQFLQQCQDQRETALSETDNKRLKDIYIHNCLNLDHPIEKVIELIIDPKGEIIK